MSDIRVLERVSRPCALGMRFWDTATGDTFIDDLRVEVWPRNTPYVRTVATPNRSGIYVANAVPNLRRFEFSNEPDDTLWATALKPYRVSVSDPLRRFLPMEFDANLPARGVLSWLAPWLSPPQAIALPGEDGSPPPLMLERIPLFSAPSRPVPEPLAVVYAQLRESGSHLPVAWGLLSVSIGGRARGLGLADDQGRVAVMFPYPEPPRMLLASPPEARNDFSWQLSLSAFCALPSPPPAPRALPDLSATLNQLSHPRSVIESVTSPAMPLRMDYRMPVTARTVGVPPQDASFLFIT